jgi:hypothetical protein
VPPLLARARLLRRALVHRASRLLEPVGVVAVVTCRARGRGPDRRRGLQRVRTRAAAGNRGVGVHTGRSAEDPVIGAACPIRLSARREPCRPSPCCGVATHHRTAGRRVRSCRSLVRLGHDCAATPRDSAHAGAAQDVENFGGEVDAIPTQHTGMPAACAGGHRKPDEHPPSPDRAAPPRRSPRPASEMVDSDWDAGVAPQPDGQGWFRSSASGRARVNAPLSTLWI